MTTTKNWEIDYTNEERREIIKNQMAFAIVQSIKDKTSPLLKKAGYKELVGINNQTGNIDNSNIAFNGFNGMAYEGMNMLLLDTAKNANNYATNIWLTGKQAMMLGIQGKDLKGLSGVSVQHIKTMEYEPQYELNSKGNKIAIIDETTKKLRTSINGEILYKRKMEKIPLKDKDGNLLMEDDGKTPKYLKKDDGSYVLRFAPDVPKYFYTLENKLDNRGNPIPLKDKDGNIIKDEKGNPKIEQEKVWIKEAILETTKVYNISQLLPMLSNEKDKERFQNVIKASVLRNQSFMPKHFSSHSNKTLESINEIRLNELSSIKVKDKDGNIQNYGLDKNTIKAINRYFYARNQKTSFDYPLKPLTKEERANLASKEILNILDSKTSSNPQVDAQAKDIASVIAKNKPKANDNVVNTIDMIKNLHTKAKLPKAQKQEKVKQANALSR